MDVIIGVTADARGLWTLGDKLVNIGVMAMVTIPFIGFIVAALGTQSKGYKTLRSIGFTQ